MFDIGFRIEKSNSDPEKAITYLNDAVGNIPCSANKENRKLEFGSWESFIKEYFKPCVIDNDGKVLYYLDQSHEREFDEELQQAVVEVKKMYSCQYDDEKYIYSLISDRKLNDKYSAKLFTDQGGVERSSVYLPVILDYDSDWSARCFMGRMNMLLCKSEDSLNVLLKYWLETY